MDLSDAGEVGYLVGYSPEDLVKEKQTIYEIIMVDTYGFGLYEIWENMLNPKENDRLIILGCPIRTNELNDCMIHESSFGKKSVHGSLAYRIESFIIWLAEKQKYEDVYILVSRVPTQLNKSCYKLLIYFLIKFQY